MIAYVCVCGFLYLNCLIFPHSFHSKALYEQPNRNVVLTGGNRGLGIHVLKKLLRCEMTVMLGKKFNKNKSHLYYAKKIQIKYLLFIRCS